MRMRLVLGLIIAGALIGLLVGTLLLNRLDGSSTPDWLFEAAESSDAWTDKDFERVKQDALADATRAESLLTHFPQMSTDEQRGAVWIVMYLAEYDRHPEYVTLARLMSGDAVSDPRYSFLIYRSLPYSMVDSDLWQFVSDESLEDKWRLAAAIALRESWRLELNPSTDLSRDFLERSEDLLRDDKGSPTLKVVVLHALMSTGLAAPDLICEYFETLDSHSELDQLRRWETQELRSACEG